MKLGKRTYEMIKWSEEDAQEYQKHFFTTEGVHATCEDYRAAASIDLEHDRESLAANHLLSVPLRVLYGAQGIMPTLNKDRGGVVGTWKDVTVPELKESVTGKALACGHYLPEELPEETQEEILTFMR